MFSAFAGMGAVIAAYGVSAANAAAVAAAASAGTVIDDPSFWGNVVSTAIGPVVHWFDHKKKKAENKAENKAEK